jgi:tRNA U34 2-thiouridine synthase MnmA/TrmU
MRKGVDTSEPCARCNNPVRISQVVRYSVAARMYWFVSGICAKCQPLE